MEQKIWFAERKKSKRKDSTFVAEKGQKTKKTRNGVKNKRNGQRKG